MEKQVRVERIENNMAVIECNDEFVDIPLIVLPESVKEGDILNIRINPEETVSAKKKAEEKLSALFAKA